MDIDYLSYLPDKFKKPGLSLYLNALNDIFEPVLGDIKSAQTALEEHLDPHQCIVAISDDEIVGILAIRTAGSSFLNPKLTTMVRVYGPLAGIFRLIGLALLHYRSKVDELYVDGVAVSSKIRGREIGTQLFTRLEKLAVHQGIPTLSLEVVDTNPKAKILYRRLGFVDTKVQPIWPLRLFFKFQFRTTTYMTKQLAKRSSTYGR